MAGMIFDEVVALATVLIMAGMPFMGRGAGVLQVWVIPVVRMLKILVFNFVNRLII